jgi:flavin-dependent dehydrogenase
VADVVITGAGPIGSATAVLLARDGHRVTVLERDPAEPPARPEMAWSHWDRPGINQFHHPHLMLPAGVALVQREIPEIVTEIQDAGGSWHNLIRPVWQLPGDGRRPDDHRFRTIAIRRPLLDACFAAVAARTPGVTIRRGTTVTGLVRDDSGRVSGVRTEQGETVTADLVVDAGGRGTALSRLLTEAGVTPAPVDRDRSGMRTYSRFYHAADGCPPDLPWLLEQVPTGATLAVPADAGHWSLTLAVHDRDPAMRALRDETRWQQALLMFTNIAQLADGRPVTDVVAMSGTQAGLRRLVVGGRPVVVGIAAVGDAWMTTNPMFGAGLTLGLRQATLLRDVVREAGATDPGLAVELEARCEAATGPALGQTRSYDRLRFAELAAETAGESYDHIGLDDQGWMLTRAMDVGKAHNGDIARAFGAIGWLQTSPKEALADPEVADRIGYLAATAPRFLPYGPSRAELLTALYDR